MNELLCRCGHGEYLHVENHPKEWAPASYPCGDTSRPGACPCLDFQLKPRQKPPIPTCAAGGPCDAPGGCGETAVEVQISLMHEVDSHLSVIVHRFADRLPDDFVKDIRETMEKVQKTTRARP